MSHSASLKRVIPEQLKMDLVFSEPPRQIQFYRENIGRDFYKSIEWLQLRAATFETQGRRCACCGHSGDPTNPLHVDHIKPRSLYPWLALEADNLQVLCEDCNKGKSNRSEANWRNPP